MFNFFGKMYIILFFLEKGFLILLLVFILFNFFSIYFYIQNFRFLVSRNKSNLGYNNNNFYYQFIINLIFFINFFAIFYLDFFIILFYNAFTI